MERKILIQWDKISLVVPEKADIPLYYKGMNNLEIQHYLGYSARTFSMEDEEKFLENINKNEKSQTFCIMRNDTEKIIWNISFNTIDHINKYWILWIVIFESDQRWSWFWKESITLLHWYAKDHLNLRKVCLHVLGDNLKAINLYKKLWYAEVWRWNKHKFYNWKYVDDILMEYFL